MKKTILSFLSLCMFSLPLLAKPSGKKGAIDPDDAYKNNCMRCHAAVQQYSPRKTATIVLHMRVRANLTKEETQALLEYLNGSSPVAPIRTKTR
jgi:hypothetical protein